MRKIIFSLIACLCPIMVWAQAGIDREIKTGLFVPKGAWLAGTTFSYSEHDDSNFKFLVLDDIVSNGYSFRISPFVGYFFKNNIAAGARFTYSRTYTNLGNLDLDLGDDLSFSIKDWTYLEHNVSATGFLRTYMGLGSSKVFGFFNELRLTYGYGEGKTTSGTGKDMTGTYQTVHNLQIGASPGLTAFVTNYAAVEVSIGVMGLDFKWTDQNTNQVEKSSRRKSSGNFKIDLFSINIGMTFYL